VTNGLLQVIGAFEKPEPFLIAGPCAIEDVKTARTIAKELVRIKNETDLIVIFKGSYEKANRTMCNSFHGVGIDRGLEILRMVKDEYGLPVTTDVHESCDVKKVADVVDLIQIPSLLCKQSKLLFEAGDTGKPINVKKGQFLPIKDVVYIVDKIKSRGNNNIMLTERGTLYGYSDIINDFRSIVRMKKLGCLVVYDATHSIKTYSERSVSPEGAVPEFLKPLTRCAAAIGANGLFLETHENWKNAKCDSETCTNLSEVEGIFRDFVKINKYVGKLDGDTG
jgi:2-dehydro-3-deoxyphosphooctonate aldolase (KDO 8-P synthase)